MLPEIEGSAPNSAMPYVWAMLILFLIGVILIGLVLYLRPAYDPLLIVSTVFAFIISIGTSIAAFIKSQETHLTVNSQLAAWKREYGAMAHAEGVIQGTKDEQDRMKDVTARTP